MPETATRDERPRIWGRVVVGTLVGVALSAFGLVAGGSPVSAHTAFVGSTPSNGSVVSGDVSEILIEFTAASTEAGEGFVVLDQAGQVREPSVTTDDGKVFRLAFDPALTTGQVGVKWSVRAGDAHPIAGSFAFAVGDEAAAAAAPVVTTGPGADDMSSMSPEEMAAMGDMTPQQQAEMGSSDMSSMTPEEMAAMDNFLQVDEARSGESLARFGRLVNIASIVLAIGALVFAATTLRGPLAEIRSLITGIRILGLAIVVGAAAEYVGVTRFAGDSLTSAWSSSTGAAAALRAVSGLAVASGVVVSTTVVRAPRRARTLSSAVNSPLQSEVDSDFWGVVKDADVASPEPALRNTPDSIVSAGDGGIIDPGLALARRLSHNDVSSRRGAVTRQPAESLQRRVTNRTSGTSDIARHNVRTSAPLRSRTGPTADVEDGMSLHWRPDKTSWLAFVGIGLAIASFWLDGHTVTKGFRPLHALANGVHVVAGSVWVGGVVTMAAVLWWRHRNQRWSDALGLVVRFSAVASVALGAVVVAGLVMAVSILDSFGELTSTQWGQTFLLKSTAAGVAVIAGAYNHFRLMPALERNPDDQALHESVRSTVTAEAIVLAFVVVVTAWLVAAAS